MEKYAVVMEELIENLTEKHTKQIKALIKSNTDAMANLIKFVKKNAPAAAASAYPTAAIDPRKTAWQKAWAENAKWQQSVHTATKYIQIKHAQSWELNANAAKYPAGWISSKVTDGAWGP